MSLKWIDGQAFAHYTEWECAQSGYWNGFGCKHQKPQDSANVLTQKFADAIKSVFLIWPISCAVHLTNTGINRNAWLGQSACFIECGNCIDCTVDAWFTLDSTEQKIANEIASHWIASWKEVNLKKDNYRRQNGQLELAF